MALKSDTAGWPKPSKGLRNRRAYGPTAGSVAGAHCHVAGPTGGNSDARLSSGATLKYDARVVTFVLGILR
jgi:hypothetical protein